MCFVCLFACTSTGMHHNTAVSQCFLCVCLFVKTGDFIQNPSVTRPHYVSLAELRPRRVVNVARWSERGTVRLSGERPSANLGIGCLFAFTTTVVCARRCFHMCFHRTLAVRCCRRRRRRCCLLLHDHMRFVASMNSVTASNLALVVALLLWSASSNSCRVSR